jgi:hypothetical protein
VRRLAIVLSLGLLSIATPARADKTGTSTVLFEEAGVAVKVPDAWPYIQELTDGVIDSFKDDVSFGAAKVSVGGKAYADTDKGIGLYVLWAVSTDEVQYAEPVIRGEIDAMTERARHASLNDGETQIIAWKEEIAAKTAGGRIEYKQLSNETRTFARTMLFVDGKKRLHEARVECVTREDLTDQNRAPCEAALASLELKLADTDVAALGALPASVPPGSSAAAADGGSLTTAAVPPSPSSGKPLPVTTSTTAPKEKHASRFLLVGGAALVLLAIAMYMTRRRRGEHGRQ